MNALQDTSECKRECFRTCRRCIVIATAKHDICYVKPPEILLDITEYKRFMEMLPTHAMLGTVRADGAGTAPEVASVTGTCHGCASYDATAQRRLKHECCAKYE